MTELFQRASRKGTPDHFTQVLKWSGKSLREIFSINSAAEVAFNLNAYYFFIARETVIYYSLFRCFSNSANKRNDN